MIHSDYQSVSKSLAYISRYLTFLYMHRICDELINKQHLVGSGYIVCFYVLFEKNKGSFQARLEAILMKMFTHPFCWPGCCNRVINSKIDHFCVVLAIILGWGIPAFICMCT